MQTPDSLQQIYEDLANRYAQEDNAANRDHCLVLAADAALRAGLPDQAERLRQRLLTTNPHHLLSPFSSLSEAMESKDVRDYVEDLRQRWSPENIEKLLRQSWMEKVLAGASDLVETYRTEEPKSVGELAEANKPLREKKTSVSAPRRKDAAQPASLPPATSGGYVMAMLLFVTTLIAVCGLLYLVFGMPLAQ